MNRFQAAFYSLIASAVIVFALIVVQGSKLVDNSARGEMVVNKDFITMISTQFRGDSEIIYMLDSKQEMMAAYLRDPNQRVIQLLATLDVGNAFGRLRGGGGGGGDRRGR